MTWATHSHHLDGLIQNIDRAFAFAFAFRPRSADDEGALIHQRIAIEKELGYTYDMMYVISSSWLSDWKSSTRYPAPHAISESSASLAQIPRSTTPHHHNSPKPLVVGAINNQSLVHTSSFLEKQFFSSWGSKLRRNLQPRIDYDILIPSIWTLLHHWYGGGPAFPRPYIAATGAVELYPITLKIHKIAAKGSATSSASNTPSPRVGLIGSASTSSIHSGNSDSKSHPSKPNITFAFFLECSRSQQLKDVIENVGKQAASLGKTKIAPDAIRLWNYPKDSTPTMYDDDSKTVEQLGLFENQQILAEIRSEDLTWPSELYALTHKVSSLVLPCACLRRRLLV